jgi:hypothetical protein
MAKSRISKSPEREWSSSFSSNNVFSFCVSAFDSSLNPPYFFVLRRIAAQMLKSKSLVVLLTSFQPYIQYENGYG